MKILILAPYSSPIVQRLSGALVKYGKHDVWVASFNEETNLDKKLIGLGEVNSFFDYFKFYKVNKIVNKLNPDVVHAHIINHYGIMSIFQKKPLLVALWGSDVMLAPNKGSLLKKKIFNFINGLVAKRANMMHTSSAHVLDELVSKHGHYVKNKLDVFYWGFPVEKPISSDYFLIESEMYKKYGISKNDQLLISPRGVSAVYDPDNVIKIIQRLSHIPLLKIVVLRGFSSQENVDLFKTKIKKFADKIVFIDELLNSNELYVLYSQAKYHLSIPISDALGGGVVEPFLLGSFPILSNLPPYNVFVEKNYGYILEDYSEASLDNLEMKILNNQLKIKSNIVNSYSAEEIASQFSELYAMIKK